MSTDMPTDPIRRIPPSPSPPDKNSKADGKKFREELQKIEKVREVDPDEQSRQRKRQLQMAEQMLQESEMKWAQGPIPSSPSPFEIHQGKVSSVRKTSGTQKVVVSSPDPVPSPSYSPAPTVQAPPPSSELQPSSSASYSLPLSPVFWQNAEVSSNDAPPQQQYFTEYRAPLPNTAPPPQDQETDDNDEEDYAYEPPPEIEPALESRGTPERMAKKEEPPAFGKEKQPASQETSKQKGESSLVPGEKSLSIPLELDKKEAPSTKLSPFFSEKTEEQMPILTPPTEKPQTTPAAFTMQASTEEASPFGGLTASSSMGTIPTSTKGEEKSSTVRAVGEKSAVGAPVQGKEEGSDKDQSSSRQGSGGHSQTAQTPLLSQFPADIQPTIQQAAVGAAPYLSNQTMALFQQMVGTIYVMNTRPGVSTTEVSLNSSAFSGSKFFGSTITIEKYGTAPNALNIRLSGPTEAVNAFNQNLSSLVAAFEHGKFPFTVRIETAYQVGKVGKPVFQRKEKKEESKDSSKDQSK